jgi:RNA polymerase sigma-70 factor (ECF subfamily)
MASQAASAARIRQVLPLDVQTHLGEELRRLYEFMQTAPLPLRLTTLIRKLERSGVVVPASLRTELLAAVPSLRHFALSLARDSSRADDLVQETLLKAWANIDRFEQGTNLNAWLFTILRNHFHSEHRKQHGEVEDIDGGYAARLISIPEQPGKIALSELEVALDRLPPDQREALVLIGIDGLSYEDAATICAVAVGTIKSRVYRARTKLGEILGIGGADDFDPDRLIRAACSASG